MGLLPRRIGLGATARGVIVVELDRGSCHEADSKSAEICVCSEVWRRFCGPGGVALLVDERQGRFWAGRLKEVSK